MGNDIKPLGGGGIWSWIKGVVKGGFVAVAKSGAASETWKLVGSLVLGMIGAGATAVIGMAQQAPGLAIAVCAAAVFALVALGATKVQALLASRPQAPSVEEAPAPAPAPALPPAGEHFGERVMRAIADGVNARPSADIWDRIDDKERQERAYQAQLAAGRAAVKVKAELMRDRLATRNHHYGDSRSDTPSTASYLAAMWAAEERGHFYDEYHRSTFMPKGKGARRDLPGDTIAELQRNVIEYNQKRRQRNMEFQDKRRDLIASGRDLAHQFREEKPRDHWETWVRKQRAYMDIQPHLGDEYQAWVVRSARTVHMTNDGSSYPEAMFLKELARLEEEWGLV